MKSNDNNMSNNDVTSNTSKAVLDQNNVPIEELFGSVTTYNNVEGSDSKSQQLRTSARVFKKMKLDSATAVAVVTDKKVLDSIKEDIKPEVRKPLRPMWSQEDKNLFFEALNEFGKDFEAIHSHITSKLKKKGLPDSVMKTKDQVRHFYYRTWHKISKHLRFSDDIKKLVQELYCLINYGELRKKVCSINGKICMKLNELIYRGSVAIRFRGKTIRVKTPMCRALRKLNQLDEKDDDLKLPTRINVELIPQDMNSWLRVQGMSQNPRLKTSVPLQKRLSTLITFLNCKWKNINAIAYENALTSSNAITIDCIPEKKVVEENKAILDPPLRLRPSSKANLEVPSINLSEYLTSHSICLNAFEARIGVKIPGEQLWVAAKGGTKKSGTKRSRNESSSEKLSPTNQKQASQSSNTDNNENCINDSDYPTSVDDVIDEAVNTILALQSQDISDNGEDRMDDIKMEMCHEIRSERKEPDAKNVRNGWTLYNCGTLSVGELYLMFGSNSNLTLEYSWDYPEQIKPKLENETCDITTVEHKDQSLPEINVDNTSTADSPTSKNCNIPSNDVMNSSIEDNSKLETTLQRLLSIAKLHYRKNIVHCPCGHVCGGKTSTVIKTKTVTKANKANSTVEISEKSSSTECISTMESNVTVTTSVVPVIIESPMPIFRRPISPGIDSLRVQLDRLKPRYCNRRGRRPRAKQVVVERRLPLLPNKIDSGRQIVQMNIISPNNIGTGPRLITPKILNIDKNEHNIGNTISIVPTSDSASSINTAEPIHVVNVTNSPTTFNSMSTTGTQNLTAINNEANVSLSSDCITTSANTLDITDNAVTPSRVGSPTGITNLLEFALTPQEGNGLSNRDVENKDDTSIPSFVGLLSQDITNTPPTSPSRILKENENQWLNSEVADFSLSSFLGHLESPMKPQNSLTIPPDDNHLSQDVDAQLQSLLTESSVDYISKFADLAAQVGSDVKK